jgi:VanZ family protein
MQARHTASPPKQQMHRSIATVMALLYTLLVLYASLYPFSNWRDQGLNPFEFLTAPWPSYWSQFDTMANCAGYVPLGFLIALALLRTTVLPWPIVLATLLASSLSLTMESLQTYLPQRIPALSDWLLNSTGGLVGATLADTLERLGVIDRWSRLRRRWLAPYTRNHVMLLLTWPVALLFPLAVPLGAGQVVERLEHALAEVLTGTPFLEWLPLRVIELQPISPIGIVLCVALGLWVPCLLALATVRGWRRRALALALVCATAVAISSMSAALSYGPENAWAWLTPEVLIGLGMGLASATACLGLQPRACLALMLVALVWQLSLVNLAPSTPYFAQTLEEWEQGRFIRFSGLAQWISWVWPYAALCVALGTLSRQRDADAEADATTGTVAARLDSQD